MRVIAIDQGTTSTRALVFETGQAPQVAASIRHQQFYPLPGHVEHEPRELLQNIRSCVAAAGDADALGLANQGESCLAWDSVSLEPLSPVIVWQDQRTFGAVERLRASGLATEVAARAGLPLDCYFSASKLAWILEHSPAAKKAIRGGTLRIGTTDSFLLESLTGVFVTDVSTASRTSLMNLKTLNWDPVLCRAFGVPIDALAPIRSTSGSFGEYANMPLRASIVDQQAALYGHGCRRPGEGKITFGTGAFALALAGATPPQIGNSPLIATVAWQTPAGLAYALEAGVYDAGAALEWAQRIGVLQHPGELQNFSTSAAIARGPVFVPALSGLACPHWKRGARGCWSHLGIETTREDLQQSLLEGIALQTQAIINSIETSLPLGDTLSTDGGLTSSRYFLQFLADITGKRIAKKDSPELTAYGCALLAGFEPAAASAESPTIFEPSIGDSLRTEYIDKYQAAVRAVLQL